MPKIIEVKPRYKFIKIGLYLPADNLKKKIEKRVKKMFQAGLLNEIKKLILEGETREKICAIYKICKKKFYDIKNSLRIKI